jgi:hypothetical protein
MRSLGGRACNAAATAGRHRRASKVALCRPTQVAEALTVPLDPDPTAHDMAAAAPELQLTLTLTLARPGVAAWHARVTLPDHSVRDFASPFELARYLSSPLMPQRRLDRSGLR